MKRNMSDVEAPELPAEPSESSIQKRTRRGEKFTPANQVSLHANDFEWDELFHELPDDAKALFTSFRQQCKLRLDAIRQEQQCSPTDCCDCCYALGHKSSPASVAVVTPTTTSASSPAPPIAHVHDARSWERHYSTNRQHFPVKNYIVHAFPSIVPRATANETLGDALNRLCDPGTTGSPSQAPRLIMEAGCGTGSVIHPLMRLFPADEFICHDVSATAVETLRSHDIAQQHVLNGGVLHTFTLDLSLEGHALDAALSSSTCSTIAEASMDFILLVFVLSAMPSMRHMVHVLRQLRKYLKPNTGRLLFRDYGALDHNFFRFHQQNNMQLVESLNFLKGDGTEQFFFDMDTTVELFALSGLMPAPQVTTPVYHCNRIVNRKNGKRMDKVFINGEFAVAPLMDATS